MSSARSRSGGIAEPDDVQAEVQVLAERARGDLRLQVAIGRGDQPHVDARVRAVGADALDLAGLEEAEQHDLHARAHLADFVEEHGAVRRHLEQARLVAVGAGEAAAHVAEQLGLEQRVGQARAVERDQRRRGARAPLMNQARDDFLADAGLAGDQHLRVGRERRSRCRPRCARIASLRPTRLTSWCRPVAAKRRFPPRASDGLYLDRRDFRQRKTILLGRPRLSSTTSLVISA